MRYLLLSVLAITTVCAQDRVDQSGRGDRSDLSIVGRIKTEAFDNSQVMDTLQFISDQYGPRLTASPECREAAEWAVKRLQSYGLENVHLEKWGPFGRSWSIKKYSVEMLEPRYALLVAAPLAWSDITHGPQTAEIMITPFHVGRPSYNPAVMEADIEKYETAWKGKLKGKIVMLSRAVDIKPDEKPLIRNSPNSELEGFEICGEEHQWVWADAKIDGNDVLVWSSSVSAPVAVRYAWADNPTCNLYNKDGLPAGTFRTDTFPGITDKKSL